MGLTRFPVNLEDRIQHTVIKRHFLSEQFGGNRQITFPAPSKNLGRIFHIREFACLTLEYNPFAPEMPGCQGLFFDLRFRSEWATSYRTNTLFHVFTRVQLNPSFWLYVGNYTFNVGRPMTVTEWNQQPEDVGSTFIDYATLTDL